jgi:putative FmdB family regulatory protein
MPTYQYRCQSCGDYEVSQRITEAALSSCSTCGKPVERLISAAAFVLKGSGWYTTDYARKSANGTEKKSEDKAAASSDAKPAAAETSGGHACGGGCAH